MANDEYISSAKNKSKAIWEVVNKETGKAAKSNGEDIVLQADQTRITDPEEIVRAFNRFFINVSKNNKPNHGQAMKSMHSNID